MKLEKFIEVMNIKKFYHKTINYSIPDIKDKKKEDYKFYIDNEEIACIENNRTKISLNLNEYSDLKSAIIHLYRIYSKALKYKNKHKKRNINIESVALFGSKLK